MVSKKQYKNYVQLFYMNSDYLVVIMAGGLGKRMNSETPKVLQLLKGKPLIVHLLVEAQLINPKKIFIIVGKFRKQIRETIEEYIASNGLIEYIDQPEPLGTGHAVQCCKQSLLQYSIINCKVLILSGDVPLVKATTMLHMLECDKVKLMTTVLDNPTGYGRIIRDPSSNLFEKIVEEKDCTQEEKKIKEVNAGIYSFNCSTLCWYLYHLKNNNSQSEYYLTDIFEIIRVQEPSTNIETMEIEKEKQYQILGVNTQEQLAYLDTIFIN